MVHRIRLRGPWRSARVSGATRYLRHFNGPTGIDQRTEAVLVVQSFTGDAIVHLNGDRLGKTDGSTGPVRYSITQQLKLHNKIWIDVWDAAERNPSTSPEVPFEVQLEMT